MTHSDTLGSEKNPDAAGVYAQRGGSSVGQSTGLIIPRSWVRAPPAPPTLKCSRVLKNRSRPTLPKQGAMPPAWVPVGVGVLRQLRLGPSAARGTTCRTSPHGLSARSSTRRAGRLTTAVGRCAAELVADHVEASGRQVDPAAPGERPTPRHSAGAPAPTPGPARCRGHALDTAARRPAGSRRCPPNGGRRHS